tara:strand:- start:316 stop:465 length:150 start_codon:yes stop_codon:yes gene_type:complete
MILDFSLLFITLIAFAAVMFIRISLLVYSKNYPSSSDKRMISVDAAIMD